MDGVPGNSALVLIWCLFQWSNSSLRLLLRPLCQSTWKWVNSLCGPGALSSFLDNGDGAASSIWLPLFSRSSLFSLSLTHIHTHFTEDYWGSASETSPRDCYSLVVAVMHQTLILILQMAAFPLCGPSVCTLGCFSGNRLSARQGKTYIQISYIQVINTEKSMLKSSLFYFF